MFVACICIIRRGCSCDGFRIADNYDLFVGFEPEFTVRPFGITCDQQDQAVLHANFRDSFPRERGMGVLPMPL